MADGRRGRKGKGRRSVRELLQVIRSLRNGQRSEIFCDCASFIGFKVLVGSSQMDLQLPDWGEGFARGAKKSIILRKVSYWIDSGNITYFLPTQGYRNGSLGVHFPTKTHREE